MSVSIETITAQGRALGSTGTWGLETSLLLALAPGMGAKAHAQTCVPRKSWQDLGIRANSGTQLLEGVGHVLPKVEGGTRHVRIICDPS